MRYLRCTDCKSIHRDSQLSREADPKDLLTLVGHCPDCNCDRFEEVRGVCDRCEQALAVKGDDYCAPCALLLDVQEENEFHADNEQEPGFYRRAS